MRWRIDRSRGPIGIDVGHRRIGAVQMARSSGPWHVAAAAALPREAPGAGISRDEARRLRGMLGERGFKGNSVVLAVPAEKVLAGVLELPPRESGAPIEQLARAELARMHKWDLQAFEMTCWDLPAPARATNSTFVMAVACTHADANELLDAFEQEGFSVRALDVPASAAARACRPLLRDAPGIAAILDLGWSSARLVLVYRDVIVYERNLPNSGTACVVKALVPDLDAKMGVAEHLEAAAAAGCGLVEGDRPPAVDPEVRAALDAHFEVILREMRMPLSYVTGQYPDAEIEPLLLIGCGAGLDGLEAHLAAGLDCRVRTVSPSDLCGAPPELDREYGASLTVAVGLSEFVER